MSVNLPERVSDVDAFSGNSFESLSDVDAFSLNSLERISDVDAFSVGVDQRKTILQRRLQISDELHSWFEDFRR